MGINTGTGKIVRVMIVLVLISIAVAYLYYREVNRSEDPRVIKAKIMYKQFQDLSQSGDFNQLFDKLDSIEQIYDAISHYKNSYEIGVLNNNRSAIYLTRALHHDYDSLAKAENFNNAKIFAQKSIHTYETWLNTFGNLSSEEIKTILDKEFLIGLDLSENQTKKVLRKRVKEIQEAQYETQRRLSVSYTNLGIVYRHNNKAEEAAQCYQKALELWERNLSAKNNLNILLDRPLEKQTFIDKLFPPGKKKK